jgi:hypothetical protein
MYLIVYTGKNAYAPQSGNSAEIPNSYEFSSFRMPLITATCVPKGAWGLGHGAWGNRAGTGHRTD